MLFLIVQLNECSYIETVKRMSEENKMFLTDLEDGQTGVIVDIVGGRHGARRVSDMEHRHHEPHHSSHDGRYAAKRLADLGLAPGTEIEVISTTFFSGPVQIKVCGSKLVLGRGLASRILIELK